MRRLISTYLFAIISNILYSQPQINNWFFSNGNGISFSSGSPANILGGQISSWEGACAISDQNGQLLFYTDGIDVWNRQHAVMFNGYGLRGGSGSSSQSSLIVPKTSDGKQYYIFTTDEEGAFWGLTYSIVDMTLSGGNGDITVKNVRLVSPTCEKITAVRHCNKKDYWIITHKYGTDAFYSYLAKDTGVNLTPVISHTGSFIPITYATMSGYLKASPDGKKLVAAHGDIGIEVASFNNQTGVVSNGVGIFNIDPPGLPYGVEFSSNSSMVYVSVTHYWDTTDFRRYSGVFQFDLSLPNTTAIINSRVQLSRYVSGNEMGALQRGPDGKIYMAQFQKSYLSIINSPEILGAGCNFVNNGFSLANGGNFSLPNFINDYGTIDSFAVSSIGRCVNTPIAFNYVITGDASSVLWNFDDPLSGPENSSTISNPNHTYLSGGTYNIKLIKYSPCGNDTLTKQISVGDLTVTLGNDASLCEQSSVLLNPQSTGSNNYLWQDGSILPTYIASAAGLYWVQVSSNSNGCIKRDSIILTPKPLPVVNLGKDTLLCINQTMLLDAQNLGAQYLWQDNTTQQTLSVNQGGIYWVEVNLNGCKKRDTIIVSTGNKPQFSLGPDQYLCPGLPLKLVPNILGVSYKWQDGSTNSSYQVTENGLYYVDISNSCGSARDSINILTGNCTVYVPTAFTPNGNGLNDYFRVKGTGLITAFEMTVFDRAGQMIFKTKDKDAGWDGRFKGIDLSTGVYVFLIRYSEINDSNPKVLKGTVTLLR